MTKVVVIGEILVEVMADTIGDGFLETQALTGPFPSGAPAIFADQVAKTGLPVAIISAVGDDDFGHLNLTRLRDDGVDVSAVYVDNERPTGSAFIRYCQNGDRNFVFNIRHSAAGRLRVTEAVETAISTADHLHVMGSSLSSPEFVDLNLSAAEAIRGKSGTVSFDPNLRFEFLTSPGMENAMQSLMSMTDLYLPSGDELTLLTEASNSKDAITELLNRGVHAIVHKRGADGATYYDKDVSHSVTACPVHEIDPTGAGDCFGGTFTALWLKGVDPEKALRLAAASGALAVTKRGPMEGTATLDELESFSNEMATT